nr:FUSC family protein [Bacillus nakamurai]
METPIPSGSVTKAQKKLYAQLQEVLNAASGEPDQKTEQIRLRSPFLFLRNALSWDSPVFIRALKYGIVLMVASLFAGGLGFHCSYWIPLSASAVMLGTTVLFTLHRAIQRSADTIIGVIIAAAVLYGRPEGVYIALCVAVLQCLLELFIVRNYVFAVLFLTANALLIAESMHANESIVYFMTARLTDVILGSLIGLAGTMLLWRRFSSKRLPELLSGVIRREGEFLQILLMPDTGKKPFDVHRLRVSLIQLRDEYDKALGEYPKSHSDVLWPAIAGAEHLGYSLLSAYKYNRRPAIDQKEVRRVAALFDSMAEAALKQTQPADGSADVTGISKDQRGIIRALQRIADGL